MNTEVEHPIVLSYSVWMRVFSWLGIPLLTLVALWLISRPLWENVTTTQYLVGFVMGLAVLYQCSIALFALKYVSMRITLFDDGLEICFKGSTKIFPWSSIGMLKEYPFASVTRISDTNGKTIMYASDSMKNLWVLKSVLRDNLA